MRKIKIKKNRHQYHFFLFAGIMLFFLSVPVFSQDDPEEPEQPFDWQQEIAQEEQEEQEEQEADEEGGIGDFEWSSWDEDQWKDKFKENKKLYQDKEALEQRLAAYRQAQQQGVNMPQRYGPITYDPAKDAAYFQSDQEYYIELASFLNEFEDEITDKAKDLALDALYKLLEPKLKVLQDKYAKVLDKVLPESKGVPTYDPLEEVSKKKSEGNKNFKYWVKLGAENIFQHIFKKNAEGKWELQREQLALLQQVGVVKYLKMTLMDWELAQSFALAFPDEVLSYAEALQDVYHASEATFTAGKALYQQITQLDSEWGLPTSLTELKDNALQTGLNQLTTAEMVNTRRRYLSKTYRQLAQRYEQYAQDLQEKLDKEDYFKMTEGERIQAHGIASEYLAESLRLYQHAEDLLSDNLKSSSLLGKDALLNEHARFQKLKSYYE